MQTPGPFKQGVSIDAKGALREEGDQKIRRGSVSNRGPIVSKSTYDPNSLYTIGIMEPGVRDAHSKGIAKSRTAIRYSSVLSLHDELVNETRARPNPSLPHA